MIIRKLSFWLSCKYPKLWDRLKTKKMRKRENWAVKHFPEIMVLSFHRLAALKMLGDLLGCPYKGEGRTKRVILAERIREGDYYPFDGDAERRLLEAIEDDQDNLNY